MGIQANSFQGVQLPGIATFLSVQGYDTGMKFSRACKSFTITVLLKGYQRPYDKANTNGLEMALRSRQLVMQGTIRVHGRQRTPSNLIAADQRRGWQIHIAAITS